MNEDGPGTPPPGAATASDDPPRERVVTQEDYERAQASPEFQELRRRVRAFAFPMTVAFLLWYATYVLLSTYAVEFMATPVIGNVNIGLLFGLGQFVTTFLITFLYVRHANRRLDPTADRIRTELETGQI
ncbi:MAG TPA: DUF485 domain-containing protein [Candidatus Ruania gallistercoris]|uniref:DUF485 domain-containing protein n=1 Tax=Candidatus Ruania gallistercoris TaxID=2838746 RepID=A0A9D2EIN9_9MICO|nr:DUF485 domain-containing protein [Candidatus Ruania gallistercoris]